MPPSPRGRASLGRLAASPHSNNSHAGEDEIQSCLLLKTLRGTKQSQFLASPHKVLEVPAEPGFEDSVPTSPGVGPRPSVGLVQWQTAERRACRSTRGPARAWDPPQPKAGALSCTRGRSRTGLTLIPKCSVTPRPCSPRTPNERLSSRKILALYLYFNFT